MRPSACLSVDMDSVACYADIHGVTLDPYDAVAPDPVFAIALERFLDLFDAFGAKATFFCVGRDLRDPDIAAGFARAHEAGHELANHSFSHLYNLRAQSRATIQDELAHTEQAIEDITGALPVGFRTPGYNLSATIARALVDRGYLYDSSVLPCPPYYAAKAAVMLGMRLRGRVSRSQMTLPQTLLAPLQPYRTTPERPWEPSQEGALWEIPMCALPGLRAPVIGTSLHLLGAQGFAAALPLLRRANPDLLNLEFHGLDLLDWSDEGVPYVLRAHQPDLRVTLDAKLRTYRGVLSALRPHYAFRTLRDAVAQLQHAA